MNNQKNIIKASCTISKGRVFKNGSLVFQNNADSSAGFFAKIYDFIAPDYPKFYKMDNLSKLGWLAAEVLLKGSLEKSGNSADRVGVVLSNSNASLDTDLRYFQTVVDYPSPSLFVYTLPNIVIGEICIRHQFHGENAFFIFDEFQPSFIHQYTSNLLDTGVVEVCICGWVEILANEYKAALYLVEKNETGTEFTSSNLLELFI